MAENGKNLMSTQLKFLVSRNTPRLFKVLLKYNPRQTNYVNQKRQFKSIFNEVNPIAG